MDFTYSDDDYFVDFTPKRPSRKPATPVRYVSLTKKRRFGVELEVTSDVSQAHIAKLIKETNTKKDVIVTGWTHTAGGNKYWHVKTDSTCGFEVASFVGRGAKDLLVIETVAKALKKGGVKTNNQCGYHIHIDVADFTRQQMSTLVALWMKIERVMCEMVPIHRTTNLYCKPLYERFRNCDAKVYNEDTFWRLINPSTNPGDPARRVALNICNYVQGANGNSNRCTVELRLPEGTIEPKDVKNWIRLFLRFVDSARTKRFPENVSSVGVTEALSFLGLAKGEDNVFLILSTGLRETKDWFLRRLLKYTRLKRYHTQAVETLNSMWSPRMLFEIDTAI